jgi:hypothetical protein
MGLNRLEDALELDQEVLARMRRLRVETDSDTFCFVELLHFSEKRWTFGGSN